MHHSIKCLSVLWLCIGLVFISCQKNDPETPGPEIPGLQFDTTTYITTLQRDTANFAHLQMSVSLPDQIDRIEIYHTDPETPLDIIEKYRGMHLLEFDYPIDISDFLQDTTLIYTLKVYDMKAHCRHKTFIFHIKPFSTPQITLPDGNKLFTDLPLYKIRAHFTTGSIPIANIRFTIDGKTENLPLPEEQITAYTLNRSISLNYLKEYTITLQVKDINGRQHTRHLTLTKIPGMDKPIKILCEKNKDKYEFQLEYNHETGKITGIDLIGHYKFTLTYGRYETANLITQISQTGYDTQQDVMTYTYEYDSQKRLQTVTTDHNGTSEIQVSQCYYDAQQLTGYTTGNTTIENIAYENLGALGKPLAEIWNTNLSEIRDDNRTKASDFCTVKIPSFIEDLPHSMFVPLQVNIPFQDIFLSRYIHLKNVSYTNNQITTDNYDYQTDSQGRLSKIIRKITDPEGNQTSGYIYSYIYEDTVSPE